MNDKVILTCIDYFLIRNLPKTIVSSKLIKEKCHIVLDHAHLIWKYKKRTKFLSQENIVEQQKSKIKSILDKFYYWQLRGWAPGPILKKDWLL